MMEMPGGSGTGFIWDLRGHVVTNSHVVEGGEEIRVTLADQSTWRAQIVGLARDKDLAVLKIDVPTARLLAIPVGSSSDLSVGQKVFAIGNPFGLDQTLTTGVISGLGREIRSKTGRAIQDVIQSDAAINSGNSGGPLLDSAGRLIGVNTSIYSQSGDYAGIGFAIPVDTVNRIVPQLLRHGRVIRPGFGVHIANDQIARQLGLEGVLVLRVRPGSSAEKAGMQSTKLDEEGTTRLGDIIFEVDGRPVTKAEDLYETLEQHAVGETVSIKVRRNPRTAQEQILPIEVVLREDVD